MFQTARASRGCRRRHAFDDENGQVEHTQPNRYENEPDVHFAGDPIEADHAVSHRKPHAQCRPSEPRDNAQSCCVATLKFMLISKSLQKELLRRRGGEPRLPHDLSGAESAIKSGDGSGRPGPFRRSLRIGPTLSCIVRLQSADPRANVAQLADNGVRPPHRRDYRIPRSSQDLGHYQGDFRNRGLSRRQRDGTCDFQRFITDS